MFPVQESGLLLYRRSPDSCTGNILAANQTCTFSVEFYFAPGSIGKTLHGSAIVSADNVHPGTGSIAGIAVKNDADVFVELDGPGGGELDNGGQLWCNTSGVAQHCVGIPVPRGSTITLTAKAAAGSTIGSWTSSQPLSCPDGAQTCTITGPQAGDLDVKVNFLKAP